MSRVKYFISGLLSSYAAIGINILYTIASVPLALHYLGKDEFGIWVLITQFSGYLMLLELGMVGAVARTLSNHKDNVNGGVYGNILMTGFVVFAIQGTIITIVGFLLAWLSAPYLNLPEELKNTFFILMSMQAVLSGLRLSLTSVGSPLWSHQRLDLCNLSGILNSIVSFFALWASFYLGLKLYGLLVSAAAGSVIALAVCYKSCKNLNFYPSHFWKSRFDLDIFKRLSRFGSGLFMMNIGNQLSSASQIIIISQTLGLKDAVTWSICTRVYTLAQQFVNRIFDSSAGGLSEMFVRNETPRFKKRFQDLLLASVVVAGLAGSFIALVNNSFVTIWTSGQVSWSPWNDYLLACILFVSTITRCNVDLTIITQKMGLICYARLVEGILFISTSFFIVPYFGFAGILLVALSCNILITGLCSINNTASLFKLSFFETVFCIKNTPLLLVLTAVICTMIFNAPFTKLYIYSQLILQILIFVFIVVPFAWFFSIDKMLRIETGNLVSCTIASLTRLMTSKKPLKS